MIGVKLILAGIVILVVSCIGIAIRRIKRLKTILNTEITDYSILAEEGKGNKDPQL